MRTTTQKDTRYKEQREVNRLLCSSSIKQGAERREGEKLQPYPNGMGTKIQAWALRYNNFTRSTRRKVTAMLPTMSPTQPYLTTILQTLTLLSILCYKDRKTNYFYLQMKLVYWNVRGIGNYDTRTELCDFTHMNTISAFYTWTNGWSVRGYTKRRLDRSF